MKRYMLFIVMIFIFMILSAKDYTLYQIKTETNIPIKKLREYFKLEDNYPIDKPLQNVSQNDIESIKKQFEKEKTKFITSITLSGMGVVFISLIIVAFLIAQFRHAKTIQKKIGPSKPCRNLNNDALIAAMFTIYLHELEVEEQNKLMLTWKRTSISMWKAVSKAETPNTSYYKVRKK